MTRKTPSITTIKRLFSVSCNRCAFPDCQNELFNSKGEPVCEICHIEAAEEGGERYNPQQSDEYRRSFENLIILCRNHHSITNNVEKYTVKVLKNMKLEHEGKCKHNPFEISDDQVDAVINNYNVQNNLQTGSGQQFITQTGDITINQGITRNEVETLVNTLFEKNFPRLRDDASKQAIANLKDFEKIFVNKVNSDLTPQEQEKFADPDIEYVLNDAIFTASRKNDEELRQTLAELIVRRVQNDESNLKKIVLNEAIATMKKLTSDQLKIITLCFILRYTSSVVTNFEQANKVLDSLKPLLDFKNTVSEFQHIQYAGCGDIGIGSFNLLEYFRNGYSMLLIRDFEESEIDSLDLPAAVKVLIHPSNETGKYNFLIPNRVQLEKYLEDNDIKDPIRSKILTAYTQHIPDGSNLETILSEKMPLAKEIIKIHNDSQLVNLKLTSVGIAIAITCYERMIRAKLDMNIWIN